MKNVLRRRIAKHFLFSGNDFLFVENDFSLFNSDRSFIISLLLTRQNFKYSKGGFTMADDNKCSHENCSCVKGEDSDYCSPQCEAAHSEGITAIKCDCGHSGCAGEA